MSLELQRLSFKDYLSFLRLAFLILHNAKRLLVRNWLFNNTITSDSSWRKLNNLIFSVCWEKRRQPPRRRKRSSWFCSVMMPDEAVCEHVDWNGGHDRGCREEKKWCLPCSTKFSRILIFTTLQSFHDPRKKVPAQKVNAKIYSPVEGPYEHYLLLAM